MRVIRSSRIEFADFAFRYSVCIVISRAQGALETGSVETQKFFRKNTYNDPSQDDCGSLAFEVHNCELKSR